MSGNEATPSADQTRRSSHYHATVHEQTSGEGKEGIQEKSQITNGKRGKCKRKSIGNSEERGTEGNVREIIRNEQEKCEGKHTVKGTREGMGEPKGVVRCKQEGMYWERVRLHKR